MGWPSTTVAAEIASPGTPKRIEVMSPVVAATAHSEQEGESFSRAHLENERKHES
jgi:hypothetical protein